MKFIQTHQLYSNSSSSVLTIAHLAEQDTHLSLYYSTLSWKTTWVSPDGRFSLPSSQMSFRASGIPSSTQSTRLPSQPPIPQSTGDTTTESTVVWSLPTSHTRSLKSIGPYQPTPTITSTSAFTPSRKSSSGQTSGRHPCSIILIRSDK